MELPFFLFLPPDNLHSFHSYLLDTLWYSMGVIPHTITTLLVKGQDQYTPAETFRNIANLVPFSGF